LLIEALNKYEGSLILVSHDRYFISKTANKIWEIVEGTIREFKGTYDEWVEWNARMKSRQQVSIAPALVTEEKKPKEEKKREPIDVNIQKEQKKVQKKFTEIEEKIALLGKQKTQAEQVLADPSVYSDKQKFIEAEKTYQTVCQSLSEAEAEYERLFEEMMKFS
ncbi:MAG: ABC transporter ATP-binding protein, partial [Sphingobacteriales bacterium]